MTLTVICAFRAGRFLLSIRLPKAGEWLIYRLFQNSRRGGLDKHIPAIIKSYRHRAEAMMTAMEIYFPRSVKWVKPEGGMFIWCRLPQGVSASRLFKTAIKNKVAYVTGSVFHANGGGDNTFRLNFSNSNMEQIREGVNQPGKDCSP